MNSNHHMSDVIPLSNKEIKMLFDEINQKKPQFNTSLIRNNTILIETEDQVYTALDDINKHRLLAVDIEGVKLSRTGKICIIQIATINQIYVFDIIKLLQIFDPLTLCQFFSFLEDRLVLKIMFDARGDSDALYHQLGITLVSVLDTQILDIAARRTLDTLKTSAAEFRISLAAILKDRLANEMKEFWLELYNETKNTSSIYNKNPNIWLERPLPELFFTYSTIGVRFLLTISIDMYIALSEKWQRKVVRASEAAVHEWRIKKIEVDRRNRANARAPKL